MSTDARTLWLALRLGHPYQPSAGVPAASLWGVPEAALRPCGYEWRRYVAIAQVRRYVCRMGKRSGVIDHGEQLAKPG